MSKSGGDLTFREFQYVHDGIQSNSGEQLQSGLYAALEKYNTVQVFRDVNGGIQCKNFHDSMSMADNYLSEGGIPALESFDGKEVVYPFQSLLNILEQKFSDSAFTGRIIVSKYYSDSQLQGTVGVLSGPSEQMYTYIELPPNSISISDQLLRAIPDDVRTVLHHSGVGEEEGLQGPYDPWGNY